jgi:hypothetical protein
MQFYLEFGNYYFLSSSISFISQLTFIHSPVAVTDQILSSSRSPEDGRPADQETPVHLSLMLTRRLFAAVTRSRGKALS